MRRLYLLAVVFAVACSAPPTGVAPEATGEDMSLLARMGPKSDRGKRPGPKQPDDVVVCAEDDGGAQCATRPGTFMEAR